MSSSASADARRRRPVIVARRRFVAHGRPRLSFFLPKRSVANLGRNYSVSRRSRAPGRTDAPTSVATAAGRSGNGDAFAMSTRLR